MKAKAMKTDSKMTAGKKQLAEVIPLVDKRIEARERFAGYVQSVAFQMTLSRQMIQLLQVVRDYGFPHLSLRAYSNGEVEKAEWDKWLTARQATKISNGTEQFSMFMKALERRGLVLHYGAELCRDGEDQRAFRLSRAGELVCGLLVESGLMAAGRVVEQQAQKMVAVTAKRRRT